jgi:hypothetical protein
MMSKRTTGMVAAGAALASAAALALVVGVGHGSDNAQHNVALTSGSAAAGAAAVDGQAKVDADALRSAKGSRSVNADARAALKAASTAAVAKPVRSVTLTLPTAAAKVGTNVTGSITVLDTLGKTTAPVANAAVAFQQKRGKVFVTVSDGVTDDSGLYSVSFTSAVNTTWRAQLTPTTGAKKYSKNVVTTASASVTWASRPALEVEHGAATSYSFRVDPVNNTSAHLEIASSATPTKWIALKNVLVPATTGVLAQSETFPKAGTWLLRGATAANATNGSGYTTALTVTVS